MNEELLQKLYSKYNLSQKGSFDQFRNDMQSPDVQRRFFDKYNLSQKGAFETFQSDLGYKPAIPKEQVVGPAEMAPVSPEQIQRGEFAQPIQEAPGFFAGLGRQAKTTFGPQKEKSQILTELQQAPVDYNEYVNKQKILYDQTKVAAPVRYDMFQSNPVPTEQDFNTLSLDQIKKKYGTSEIANRTKGLMGDENRFSISVGSLLDQVASVPKEQQASTFKNLVNDALRKVREQQVYRKGQLEYQMERETAGIPQTFGEAVSRGELGTYIGSAIGGAAGSSAVALTKPLVGGYELTKGEILDMANKAKAESLGQTENEFIVSGGKLDSNSAVEVGSMVSSALEYVGLGKIAAPLFKNLVKEGMKSAMKKGIVEVGKGAAAEFSTEFVQSVNEQVSSQMAAGKKPEEIVINWDDALESGIQGGIGGGGLTTVSTVTSGLANAIAKRRKIEQIDNDINRLTDTGSPEINQQIDNELNLITPTGDLTYDQEGQIGVPSAEQQGAAPVQEGPQPEGRGTETETGGVLQVSPETPGAQAEVTPEVTPQSLEGKDLSEIAKQIGIQTNWDMRGESDFLSGTSGRKGYVQRMLPEWNRASQLGEINPNSKITYDFDRNKVTAKDENGVTVGLIQIEILKGKGEDGISHLVVAPEFAGKGVADEMYKILKKELPYLDLTKTEQQSEGFVKFASKYAIAEAYQKAKQDGSNPELVKAVEDLLSGKPITPTTQPTEQVTPATLETLTDGEIPKIPITVSVEGFTAKDDNKAVDETGNPIRLYSGRRIGGTALGYNEGAEGLTYFTTSPQEANYYSVGKVSKQGVESGRIQPATFIGYVKIKNPWIISSQEYVSIIHDTTGYNRGQVIQELKDKKYDGIIVKDVGEELDNYTGKKSTWYIPFNTDSIMSALSGKPITPAELTTQVTPVEDLEAEGLRELEQLEQPTPQPTVEQPTVEQPVAEQPQLEEELTQEELDQMMEMTLTVSPEQKTENQTVLTAAGYSQQQIDSLYTGGFTRVGNDIVDVEKGIVVKPATKKVAPVRRKRPVVKKPATTFQDIFDIVFTEGSKLSNVLDVVARSNSKYAALAKAILNSGKTNNLALDATLSKEPDPRYKYELEEAYYIQDTNKVHFIKDRFDYLKNNVDENNELSFTSGLKINYDEHLHKALLHETLHVFTANLLRRETGIKPRQPSVAILKLYQKTGKNEFIKTIISSYLQTREEINANSKSGRIVINGKDFGSSTDPYLLYGTSDLYEFVSEAFTNPKFQSLLNELKVKGKSNLSIFKKLLDSLRKILGVSVKNESVLEEVVRATGEIIGIPVARNIPILEQRFKSISGEQIRDPRAAALIKIAQGLINKGATPENVIQQVKDLVTPKFNINVDAYAQDILAGINVRREAVAGPFNAEQAAVDIMDTPYWTYLTGLTAESKEAAIEEKVQDIADFLRDKVTSKEQVTEFQKAWNAKNPDYKISNNDVNKAWQLIKEPTIDKETITISINDLIKKKWQARAKGQTQGIRETTETFRELITMIRDTMKNNPLSRVQERAILTKLKKVNLFTPGSLSKLKDFINKVIQDAEYAAKLNTASGLKRRLKNPPKSVPANIQDISKKLAQIDPTDDMLDEYVENGSKIIRSFLRPDAEMYSPVNIADVEVFIDNYYTNREKDMVASLLNATSKATEQAVDEFVNPTSPEDQQAALEKIIAEQKRVEVLNNLSDIANNLIFLLQDFEATTVEEKETVKILRKYKPENVEDIKSLVRFIRIADNIITNNDFSGAGVIESEIRAEVEARPTIDEVKKSNNNINRIGFINSIWLGMTGTLQNIYENLTKSSRGAVALLDYLGLSKYEETSSRAKQAVNKVEKDIDQKIGELNKKHNTQLLNNENQIKFTILSELAKYVDDPTANINKIVANIEADIRDLLNSDKEYAKELASTIYGVLDDMYNQGILKGNRKVDPTYPDYQFKNGEVKSSAQVVEGYFERTAPAVHELWNYFTTNVFTDKLYEDSKKVNSKFFNGILTKYKNYIPTSFRKLGEGVSFEDAYRNETYKPQQNRRFKEASRSRRADATYSYIQSIKDAVNGYKEVVHDNSTMEAQFQFEAAIARPELREIMSGEYRDFLIKDYKSRTDRSRSTVNAHLEDAQLILDSLSRNIKNLMNITKLFSVRQIAQQFIPAYASLVTLLGTKFKYLHTSIPEEFNDVIKMVPLGEANLEEGILNLNNQFNMSDKAAYNSVIKALEKSQNATAKFAVNTLTPVIGKPDLNIRKRGWIAFYIKRLEELGVPIEEIDLKTEKNKQDEETRRLARQYATLMIGKAMAPSTKFSRAELWKQKGVMNALVNTYLPFGTFTINFKNRVISALDKISNNKEEGYVELLSATNEAIAFSAIQVLWAEFVVLPLASAVYSSLFGYEFGEEDEEEFLGWDPKQWSDFWTKVYLDVNPTAISFTENFWLDTANFAVWLKADTDKDFQEWKEDREAKSIFRKQTYETQGYFGMAGDQLHDLFYASSNLYNSKEFDGKFRVANDLYKDTELEITEDIEKIARYDFLMNTLGTIAPGELKSVWRMIRQEEIKYQREKEKKSNK